MDFICPNPDLDPGFLKTISRLAADLVYFWYWELVNSRENNSNQVKMKWTYILLELWQHMIPNIFIHIFNLFQPSSFRTGFVYYIEPQATTFLITIISQNLIQKVYCISLSVKLVWQSRSKFLAYLFLLSFHLESINFLQFWHLERPVRLRALHL